MATVRRSFSSDPRIGSTPSNEESSFLAPLEQSNLREKARDMIRAGIVSGQIKAGRLYPIAYFQAQLRVSATPIREALFDLASEGLVEAIRNRGFRVPTLSDDDLGEIFELRDLLEVYAIRKLVGRCGKTNVLQCLALAEETRVHARANNLQGFLAADRQFHQHLLAATGNQRLADIVMRLRDATRVYELPEATESGQLAVSAEEHLEIIKAVNAGDAGEAQAWMRHHLAHTRGVWLPRRKPDAKGNDQSTR